MIWIGPEGRENWIVDRGGAHLLSDINVAGIVGAEGAGYGRAGVLPRSSGPLPLIYAGTGFHYDVPLADPDGKPAGVVRGSFSYRDLLAPSFWNLADTHAIFVEIDGKLVFGDRQYGGEVAAADRRRVLGEDWRLSLAPLGPLVLAARLGMAITASVLIGLMGLLAAAAIHFRARAIARANEADHANRRLQLAIEAMDVPFAS